MNKYRLEETIETLAQLLVDAKRLADYYQEESMAKTKEINELQRKINDFSSKYEEGLVEA